MQKQNKTLRYAVYALLAILVSTIGLPLATPVKAQTTLTVSVNPENFGAGTVLLVSASTFSSGSVADIYISTNGLATISPKDILIASNVPLVNGAITNVNATTPSNLAPGIYYIKVTNGQQVGVSSPIEVLTPPVPAITLNVTAGIPGTGVLVSGTNFPAGATSITIYLIGSSGPVPVPIFSVSPTVSSSGTFNATFSVPVGITPGNYVVLATVVFFNGQTYQTYGASTPFQVIYFLAPELTQWDGFFMPGGEPLYSIRAGQAGLNLSFWGVDLPEGTVQSVAIYNSAGQEVTYGILPHTTVNSFGFFVSHHNAAIGVPEVNVTLAGALMPGVGYYAVFTIGGVAVQSLPFIASVPTNGLFNACLSSPFNPYSCTSSASSSGIVYAIVQGYGFGAGDNVTLTVNVINGAYQVAFPLVYLFKADPNGALFTSFASTNVYPEQTANVVVADHLASGFVQKVVGTYSLVPQFTVTDLKTQQSQGGVGDELSLTGLSFAAPFEATSITFTSLSNGYSVTLTKDAAGHPLTMYYSAPNGTFPATSSGTLTTLIVKLPALPGGNTSVVISGETAAGKPVSFQTYFWVDSTIEAAYYVNLTGNSWAPFSKPQSLFSGDIIDLLVQGYPAGVQATVNFSAKTFTARGVTIMGSTAFPNGTDELIVSVPNLPPSTPSGFGPYTIVLNGASSNGMMGKTIKTPFEVNVLLPGQYSTSPPHVYVNPQNITRESVLGAGKPGVFPTKYTVGTPLTVLGVGFTGSAKEYVYISATVAGSMPTYQFFNTVNTSVYGTFSFTMPLPNESSYASTTSGYERVTYSVAVYQYNPSAIVQSPTTSTPTGAEAVPFSVTPSIILMPDQGTPNTTVTVVGTGWASGETVSIYMQTVTLVPPGVAKVSSDGFFTTTFKVPAFAAGPVTVVAKGSSSKTNATAPFTVLSSTKPTLNVQLSAPSTAQEGGSVLFTLTVEVNGTAYSVPLSSISGTILEPNGVTVPMSFVSVGTGLYQFNFTVPQLAGTYTATVTVTYDGLTAQAAASFYVAPPPPPTKPTLNVQLSAPSTAQEGGSVLFTLTVEVNGTAYSVPLSSIKGTILEPNGVTVPMSFVSVGTGLYQFNFTVPQLAGTYTATVTVTYDGLTAQAAASFYVAPPPPPTKPTLNVQLSAPSTAQEGGSVLFTLTVEVNGTAYSVPLSSISGTILEPNGVTVPMSFLSVGTGQYQYIFAVPQLAGTYTATVTVTYDGLTAQAAASFYVPTPTTPTTTTVNLTGVSSALSSISSAESGLSQQLTTLENDLTKLSSQTAAALMALGNSISALASSFSALNSHIGTAETYSLGALVIAFIALIVIIYGVFVRRMP